jgi:hypothetical protein
MVALRVVLTAPPLVIVVTLALQVDTPPQKVEIYGFVWCQNLHFLLIGLADRTSKGTLIIKASVIQ